MRSYSDLQQFAKPQPQPVPHRQFLSPDFPGQQEVDEEEEQVSVYDQESALI